MSFTEHTLIILWEIEGKARFLFRHWADECAVYDNVTGDTHLFEPVGVEVLLALQQAPASAESLCKRVASRFEAEPNAEFSSMLESVLIDFERLALIRRTPQ